MQYLTYEEYQELGGICDLTAFNRNIDRVCGMIDNHTFNRVERMEKIPRQVKACCRDLVEYLVNNNANGASVSSISQSAGGVSESVSYAAKNADTQAEEMKDIIFDYLLMVKDEKGTSLLYRGASR